MVLSHHHNLENIIEAFRRKVKSFICCSTLAALLGCVPPMPLEYRFQPPGSFRYNESNVSHPITIIPQDYDDLKFRGFGTVDTDSQVIFRQRSFMLSPGKYELGLIYVGTGFPETIKVYIFTKHGKVEVRIPMPAYPKKLRGKPNCHPFSLSNDAHEPIPGAFCIGLGFDLTKDGTIKNCWGAYAGFESLESFETRIVSQK